MTMFKRHVFLLLAVCALAALAAAASASAQPECAGCRAWWHVNFQSLPAVLPPGGEAQVTVRAQNLGDAESTESRIVLSDALPEGLTAQSVALYSQTVINEEVAQQVGRAFCEVQPRKVVCNVPAVYASEAYGFLEARIAVDVSEDARSGEVERASVAGGGPGASASRLIAVGRSTPFGVEGYELRAENADGTPDTQAGSHPFQLTTNIAIKQGADVEKPPAMVKDLRFNLPPGLIGNPTPFPQCPLAKFLDQAGEGENACPDNTVVGVASVDIASGEEDEASAFHQQTQNVPLVALVPSVGEPARFGFFVLGDPVYLDTSVRTGGDYGVTVTVPNITQTVSFISSSVTFWGVPGDPRHDSSRGWNCLHPGLLGGQPPCAASEQHNPPPLLTLPSACTGPLHTTVEADSWKEEGVFSSTQEYTFQNQLGEPAGLDGCNQVPFTPSVRVTPDGQAGSTPTGLTVDEHVPQESSLNASGLAEADVKGLSVTLPEGVALNPAAADGLLACSMEEIALQSREAGGCPEASKVATVKIKTPLLPNPLEGGAYLATQDTNPFGSLVGMYIEAYDPTSGIRAKAAGEVLENPVTGQLTAHFEGDPVFENDPAYANDVAAQFLPQTPFEDVELHFFGGDRAPLTTPALCGAYTTTGTFTPWSEGTTTESSSTFNIVSGPNGSPCSDPLPFSPTLTAGTTSNQAGGFTPFVVTMGREDGEQSLQGIQLTMPLGMSGTLSNVKLCGEEQANAGTCGPESEIGETIVSVGVGGDPYTVKGGKVYITGPYKGAPFGLSIVNPAKAGPFNLGYVVVRAKIEVNEETAALTITTDNEGPYKIPTIIDGIPLQIRHVNVNINRPGFTFNATNCSPLKITGTLTSAGGASSALSIPYQVTNCAVLAFKPKLEASTSGKSSRLDGTSLNVKLSYPAGPYDANISKVKVELPKGLPSRLPTLQKACLSSVFESNPAACPAASVIGHATATTPVLPVPLSGPAYFVSHGGEAWPSLIIVLQGYGVTVHLVGTTLISKQGVTSSTFKTVPDVPVGSFELNLPAGPYSALTALGNLCKPKSLSMPTEFVGQNGALINTDTKIAVTGCGKVRKASHKKRHKGRKDGKAKKANRPGWHSHGRSAAF
ncbi:MAG TPA: hypothetical protein VNV42_13565 [Solirubrobacteraceae bacterium]|nr:hypothetical protein [Solirubrobacteraceae bacterium]